MALSAGEIEVLVKMKVEGEAQVAKAQAALKGLGATATTASQGTGLLGSSFVKLTASFTVAGLITQAAGALVGLSKEVLASSGHLVDLAGKTGLSLQTLQQFDYVAKQTGTSLESFSQAAFLLGVNLEKGTDGARAAVDRLGLSYQDLLRQSPDQQFDAIAAALGRMADPQERNRVALELFGRAAKEILPAIAEGYGALAGQATVSSDRAVKALDRLGDALSASGSAVKSWATSFIGAFAAVQFNIVDQVRETVAAIRLLETLPTVQALPRQTVNAPGVPQDLEAISQALTESAEKDIATKTQQAAAAAKLTEATDRLNAAFRASITYFNTADNIGTQFMRTVEQLTPDFELLETKVLEAGQAFIPFASNVDAVRPKLRALGNTLKTDLMNVLASLPQTIANAFTGGGGLLGAARAIGSQLGSVIGTRIGASIAALGKLGGPIGAALGSLVGPIIGWIGNLFGRAKRQAAEAAAAARQAAAAAAAALDALIAGLESNLAGLRSELDGLMGDAQALGYTFDTAGNLVSVSWEKMDEAAKKYGITQDALGPAFQQLRLHDLATALINDFTLLEKGGVGVGTILLGMAPQISALVQQSLRFGTEIPANMKPWVDELLRAGLLTDENGEALTDLAGLKFGAPIATEFEKISSAILTLLSKIDALIVKLDELLAPRTLVITPVVGQVPELPAPTQPGFALGTLGTSGAWFGSFGAGTPTTLHGTEAVIRPDQASAFAAAYGGGGDAALLEVRRLMRMLPSLMSTALKDALGT